MVDLGLVDCHTEVLYYGDKVYSLRGGWRTNREWVESWRSSGTSQAELARGIIRFCYPVRGNYHDEMYSTGMCIEGMPLLSPYPSEDATRK